SVFTDRPRGPRHHAWEAQRSLATCTSCHSERDCTSCHATSARGGQGGLSPHPPGFGGSGGCRAALERNPRPCVSCHSPGDSALERCRR
ncbi:MAG: cytochrome c family protein, partial [Deltaproteobacteria bacterium]|nr:cytochrome c family protein [Deltaproteobacteria bacterium]